MATELRADDAGIREALYRLTREFPTLYVSGAPLRGRGGNFLVELSCHDCGERPTTIEIPWREAAHAFDALERIRGEILRRFVCWHFEERVTRRRRDPAPEARNLTPRTVVRVYGDTFAATSPLQRKEAATAMVAKAVAAPPPPKFDDPHLRTMLQKAFGDVITDALTFNAQGRALFNGLTTEQCLERYADIQRSDYRACPAMTEAQLIIARATWTTRLKDLCKKSADKERLRVLVDIQDVD
jgi:hypothetical protein